MATYTLNGREVEIIETAFELGESCYVVNAIFADTDEELTESELEELTETYQEELYEDGYVSAASHAYDTFKDIRKYGLNVLLALSTVPLIACARPRPQEPFVVKGYILVEGSEQGQEPQCFKVKDRPDKSHNDSDDVERIDCGRIPKELRDK